jgi:hypothetical protein
LKKKTDKAREEATSASNLAPALAAIFHGAWVERPGALGVAARAQDLGAEERSRGHHRAQENEEEGLAAENEKGDSKGNGESGGRMCGKLVAE